MGDLQTIKFNKEIRTDEWTQTSLVIEGDLGFAQLVSATSYYDRDFLYANDTQSYAAYFHYSFGVYYGYATYDFGLDPTGYLINDQNNESLTQEFRLSGATDRVDWTVGAFWQEIRRVLGLQDLRRRLPKLPSLRGLELLLPGYRSHRCLVEFISKPRQNR